MPLMLNLALNGSNQTGGALAEDIRLARAAGFGALEMWIPKLEYALQGGSLAFVKKLLKGEKGEKPVRVVALNRLSDIIFRDQRAAAQLDAQTHSLAASAMSLDAPWIVVEAGLAPAGVSAADVTAEVGRALAHIGKITTQYGAISVALAPGGAVSSVGQALAALQLSGRNNVGLALDASDVEAALADTRFRPTQLAVVHLPAGLSAPAWNALAVALTNAGFTGFFSAEPPAAGLTSTSSSKSVGSSSPKSPTDVSAWAAHTVAWLQQASTD